MDQGVLSFVQPIVHEVWDKKYRFKQPDGSSDEKSISDTHMRVAKNIFKDDPRADDFIGNIYHSMVMGDLVPAGRIHAGAGTGRRVTLINCFVSNVIADSMRSDDDGVGIMDSLCNSALTMQMGGGIGIDFSPIRPEGAEVKGVGSIASGPLEFMDMWDAMCRTIMSSGSRRGAMMATLRCDHPDITKFITAKEKKGRLTNFNVSVLVTTAFMDAVRDNKKWELYFHVPPHDPARRMVIRKNGKDVYLYETVNARELWDKIIRHTYEYSEPGVVFIDRINARNNLYYIEEISCVNPCGEQPLPPNGDCNLSAINLATMVIDPFGDNAHFDFERLVRTVALAVRFLDNVLDVTFYPTEVQKSEALAKRRIGLGITGLANMLQQMKYRYGSEESINCVKLIMRHLCNTAYRTSIELAEERGSFPMFDCDMYLQGDFIKKLPDDIKNGIKKHGIRNAVLLTIAPTGTTSLYYGNVSSGLEPTFSWTYLRKMLMPDDTYQEFDVEDYGYSLYVHYVLKGQKPNGAGLPEYMVSAQELTVDEHLNMQAACQEFIDSSISKTINCPEDISFEEFKGVYTKAYALGLKGCTTYRPNDIRGSVLTLKTDKKKEIKEVVTKEERPEVLDAKVYKVKWPGTHENNYYITITDLTREDGSRIPMEVFITTKDVTNAEWITGMCRTLSAILRRGGDVSFVCEELKQVYSPLGGQWIKGKYVPSLVAMIGITLERHMIDIGYIDHHTNGNGEVKPEDISAIVQGARVGTMELCNSCGEFATVFTEGCRKCLACGYSNCG